MMPQRNARAERQLTARKPRIAREHLLWLLAAVVAAATFLAFAPALRDGFVAWDDDKNFLGNPHYRGLDAARLRWMWTTFHLGHYVPLSWMTLGLDYVLWGMNPAGYHLTNLLLHAANAVLVYFLARRLLQLAEPAPASSEPIMVGAAFAALVFALHPLRVESVVWITERRDVLSGFFCLLTVLLYIRANDASERRHRWYWPAIAAFACALLSKATSMTIPAILIILNVYPLRRIGGASGWWSAASRRAYIDVLPFASLAVAAAVLSIVALHPPPQLNLPEKGAVSAYSLGFYVWKTIVPVNLSPVYEMPQRVDPMAPRFLAGYAFVIAAFAAALAGCRRRPGLVAAWIAFVAITLPMLGIVQNGPQIAADRYTYHAAPALALVAGAWYAQWSLTGTAVPVRRALAAAILLTLGVLTWRQSGVWRDSETLWSRVLRLDSESSIGHVGMANVRFKQDRLEEAVAHAVRAVEIAPGYAQAHNDLGVGLARLGRLAEAVDQYQHALSIEPGYDEPHSNWGVVLARQGDLDGAIAQYRLALSANPDNADAHVNWANALVRRGKTAEAVDHYQQALVIRPDNADAEHNWGVALAREGRLAEAAEHFRRALLIDPNHAEARGYLERALQMLRGALRTSPKRLVNVGSRSLTARADELPPSRWLPPEPPW